MNYSKVNVRYAKAIFLTALEENKLEEVNADFNLILQIAKENKEFEFFLNAPIYNPVVKKQFIETFFKQYFHNLTINFLILLTEKRRENRLLDIIRNFFTLYKQHFQIVDAQLITAYSIDEVLLKEIRLKLEQELKKSVNILNHVDQNIVGGFVLRIEDKEYDASIRNQLNKIKISLEKTSMM